MLRKINWRIFFILFGAGLVGFLAVLPFTFDLILGHTFGPEPAPEMPLWLVITLALLQNGVLLAVLVFFGMLLSERVGLKMPLITAWANGERPRNVQSIVASGMLVGLIAGAVLIAFEAIFFLRHLPAAMLSVFDIPLWKRLLAGVLYGGITEELLMRLFLVSLLAWLLGRLFKTRAGLPSAGAFWAAIILVAVVFGLGHLPVTSVLTPLTPMIVVRALLLNSVVGIACGFLYWRKGLEAAMLAHMSAHLIMQAPGIMLLKKML